MSFTPLTFNCLNDVMNNTYEGEPPVLQVLGSKKINTSKNDDNQKSTERYRLLLSDGKNLQSFAMLATNLNELVHNDELSDYTIIRLKDKTVSTVNKGAPGNERKVLVVTDIEVLHKGSEVRHKIGQPANMTDSSKVVPSAQPSSPPKPVASTYRPPPSDSQGSSQIEGRATHPISSLSPYQNKWVIKARVTAKSAIRTWSNAKGEGKLFSFDLMDESGQIRATAFRDLVDRYYDMIEVDRVYYITKCQLKPANKQYSRLPNDYEMTLNNDTVIQECTDADDIPTVKYNFIPISQIAELENNTAVDIIGVCRDVGEVRSFTAKSGRDFKKRDVTLVDRSNQSVTLTLWGKDADDFNNHDNPVLLVHDGRINDFNGGKSVSLGGGSVFKVNPDCDEGHRLRGWYDNGGANEIHNSVSARVAGGGDMKTEWATFHESKIRNLGSGDKPDFYQLKGIVHIIKSNNATYKACPTQDCNKKVVDMDNGQYRCEKCNTEYPNFKYRLMLNMSIADWTSNRWVTAFADQAEMILGKSSQEVGDLLEMDKEEGEALLASAHFKTFLFKLRTKVEFFSDSPRNRINVQSVAPLNFKDYNEYLVKNIQRLTGIAKH